MNKAYFCYFPFTDKKSHLSSSSYSFQFNNAAVNNILVHVLKQEKEKFPMHINVLPHRLSQKNTTSAVQPVFFDGEPVGSNSICWLIYLNFIPFCLAMNSFPLFTSTAILLAYDGEIGEHLVFWLCLMSYYSFFSIHVHKSLPRKNIRYVHKCMFTYTLQVCRSYICENIAVIDKITEKQLSQTHGPTRSKELETRLNKSGELISIEKFNCRAPLCG